MVASTAETMNPTVNDADGLTSTYQRTNITAAGALAVMETGGHLIVGVTVLPKYVPIRPALRGSFQRPQAGSSKPLEARMAESELFHQLVGRGLADLEHGRYVRIEELKRRLGGI